MPDPIEKQYVKHPYPLPIHDMAERLKSGTHKEASGLDLVWNKLFPEKVYSDQLDVLIAGCGTNQAVYHALKFPSSNYYAIDVSQTSIDHVKKMIKMYDIKNLDVERREIEDLTEEKAFDYVISINTVHNLELEECEIAIKEIQRVCKKNSFITVDAFRNDEEKERMYKWNLTAKTILSVNDWKALFKKINYKGDYYWFIP